MRRVLTPLLLSFVVVGPFLQAQKTVDKLSIVDAYFEDPERRIVRSLTLNAGESCYLTFRIAGFKTEAKQQRVELEYRVQFLDPAGAPVVEDFSDKVEATLSPQDQNWMPKIDWTRVVPTFAPAGDYKIKVHVEDKIGKASTDFEVSFKVRGEIIADGEKMKVQQFIFSDIENGRQKNDDVYHQGTTLWARYKLGGYKLIDKTYWVEQGFSILDSGGKVLFTNPPVEEKNRLFYPPRVLSNSFNLDVSKGVKAGDYILRLDIKDKLGETSITYESKFRVEP